MIGSRHSFENREALAIGLSHKLAQVLSKAISKNGSALLAVSGGTTPVLLFQHLRAQPITWEKVTVTLVDERQVPENNPRSNAKLVKENLLQGPASAATFVPLFNNPNAANPGRFDAVVLGMGTDGHTASFFPGGDTLAEAIDPHTDKSVIEITAPGSGEPRLTFTLPKLASAGFVALHIEGKQKHDVLETALAGNDKLQMPIRAMLQSKSSINVYWCP
jgi:6-phosphogluconolactonase